MITNRGREEILNSLATNKKWANSIALGIGGGVAAAEDVALSFLLTVVDVQTAIVVPVDNKVHYKASLEADSQFSFLEIGCYGQESSALSADGESAGQLLVVFDHNISWNDVAGVVGTDAVNGRASSNALSYAIDAAGTVTGFMEIDLDLSALKLNTIFKMAYFADNLAEVSLRFKNDDSNYYSNNGLSVANGYNIASVNKSDFSATGSPDWSTIGSIEISATALASPGTLTFDALRYDSVLSTEQYILSRVVLPELKTKTYGRTMDIEYSLELD